MKKVGHTSEFSFGIYWWTSKNLKNQNFEKMKKKKKKKKKKKIFKKIKKKKKKKKKNCWRYHFTHVYQKPTIIRSRVPEIQSLTELFCHFGSLFALLSTTTTTTTTTTINTTLTTQKTKILKKWKNHHLEMSSF